MFTKCSHVGGTSAANTRALTKQAVDCIASMIRGAAVGFRKSIPEKVGPAPGRFELAKGHVLVDRSNVCGIRIPRV